MSVVDLVTNELMIASKILKTNNVSHLAKELGHRPLIIFTGLIKAQDAGKLEYNKKKDIIKIDPEVNVDLLAVTEGTVELMELLEEYVYYWNTLEKKDSVVEEIQMLLGGVPKLHIEMAVLKSKKLTTYDVADPNDKKSVYTFVTLKENLDKQYGLKQFKKK